MRLTHAEKQSAVREYLERHCIGWERRRLGQLIVAHLKKRGFAMSEETFQHICKDLMMSGVAVCSDDTKGTGGYFVARCRREMDDYLKQLRKRIDGTLTRANCARKIRDAKFPQSTFVFAKGVT